MSGVAHFPLRDYERGIGPPPSHLDPDHADAWDEIVRATPAGTLVARHRIFVELTAGALVRYRKHAVEGSDADRRTWSGIVRHELATCRIPRPEIKRLMNLPSHTEQ
jgi:hypothetical protein